MKWTLCVTLPKFIAVFILKNGIIPNNCKTSAGGGGFSVFLWKRTLVVQRSRYTAGINIERRIFMETLRLIGFIAYCLAGYWAVNRTIYANYVLYGDLATIFMRKVIVGMLAGPVCIPLAIIKAVVNKKSDE